MADLDAAHAYENPGMVEDYLIPLIALYCFRQAVILVPDNPKFKKDLEMQLQEMCDDQITVDDILPRR
jgi:hypothetical protein